MTAEPRSVSERLRSMIEAIHGGFVTDDSLEAIADAIEAALAEKDARIAELERECEDLMRIPDRCDQVALRGEE